METFGVSTYWPLVGAHNKVDYDLSPFYLPQFENKRYSNRAKSNYQFGLHDFGGGPYVKVKPGLVAKILSLLASNDSPANCGSSFTSILYRDTNIVRIAMPSVSKNLDTCKYIVAETQL